MRKSRKLKIKKQNRNKCIKSQKGGIYEDQGLPPCTEISTFRVTDDQINGFERLINSPMDCVITAMQIIGMLDGKSANIMRVTTLGIHGITKIQIELIFTLFYNKNFDFKQTYDYDEFTRTISATLPVGHVVFGGYVGHVFILARHLDGSIYYIDPQINTYCNVADDQCSALFTQNQSSWFLMTNSVENLTPVQYQTLVNNVYLLQQPGAVLPVI